MTKPDRIILKTDDVSFIIAMGERAVARENLFFMDKTWMIEHYSTHPANPFGGAYRGIFEFVALLPLPGPSFLEISG
jgi:hypothetical protein